MTRCYAGRFGAALVETRQPIRSFEGHSAPVWAVAFSPDGRYAFAGTCAQLERTVDCQRGAWTAWDVATGDKVRTIRAHTDTVSTLAVSPGGAKLLTGSWDNTITLWDAASGAEIHALAGHSAAVTSVAFSPDGSVAVSCATDRTLKLWDVASGDEIRTLTGHENSVMSVAFSLDGQYIVSGSLDGTAKLWGIP